MPFPPTHRELVEVGYTLTGLGQCRGCEADIEWWKTPEDKFIPMNRMLDENSEVVSHWATCPKANQFRKEERKARHANKHTGH